MLTQREITACVHDFSSAWDRCSAVTAQFPHKDLVSGPKKVIAIITTCISTVGIGPKFTCVATDLPREYQYIWKVQELWGGHDELDTFALQIVWVLSVLFHHHDNKSTVCFTFCDELERNGKNRMTDEVQFHLEIEPWYYGFTWRFEAGVHLFFCVISRTNLV